MPLLTRYNTLRIVTSPLDPIEDIASWVSGLKSSGYTSDLLSKVHRLAPAAAVRSAASAAAHFATTAVGLLDQAYAGPPNLSFLPLYYAILNLSKIYIIAAGRDSDLQTNRRHGTSYDATHKSSQHLLTEQLTIWPRGIFSLFYSVLTDGHSIAHTSTISLRCVYPFLAGVTHEYRQAFGQLSLLQPISITTEGDNAKGWRLRAKIINPRAPEAVHLRHLKAISGFQQVAGSPGDFLSKSVKAATELDALDQLRLKVRRFLLYATVLDPMSHATATRTPLSNRHLMLPEEVPIWLAFNHLSNIVRYNPEFLRRIEDSSAWPMLLAMRKHCLLRFLLLFWSCMQQEEFVVSPD